MNHDVTHTTVRRPAASVDGTGPSDVSRALADLESLGAVVEALVLDAGEAGWNAATPAVGWDVATQVAHLHWTDLASLSAIADRPAFDALVEKALADPEGFVDAGARELAELTRAELLERWRAGRAELAAALAERDPGEPIAWFGPPMRPKTMATARIMETFAHGYDIADGLGPVAPGATVGERAPGLLGTAAELASLPHVARIGVKTRDFAFTTHGETPPTEPFGHELTSPSGETLTFGPDAAVGQRVDGPLRDFCLLVTQRIAPADTSLEARGNDAAHWLEIAQSFAGLPGQGRG